MRRNKWFGMIASVVLLLSVLYPTGAFANSEQSLQDESIYDLLVDRFNNGNFENDENIDVKDMSAFSGGDFAGITSRLNYLVDMGFTLVSIGPVFSTATYDGNEVLDYEKLEPHFGTAQELTEMVEAFDEYDVGVVADFPLNGVSENHVWVEDQSLASTANGDGTVNWDTTDDNVKETLKNTIISFVEEYNLAGIRLTQLGDFDEDFLNEVIAALKDTNDELYVLSNEASTANFDSVPNLEKMEALKQGYVQVDPQTAPLSLFDDKNETDLIQFDDLTGPRFTYDMIELRMFPPTRWKLAVVRIVHVPRCSSNALW